MPAKSDVTRIARDLLDEVGEERSAQLAEDPLSAIPALYEVELRTAPVDGDAKCPVYGSYNPTTAEIIVREALSERRMFFTALHELGHMLLNTTDVGYTLLDLEYTDELEEEICDSFAGQTLIPTELVDGIVGERGPTAESVVSLYEKSRASRAACAVRALERIIGPGHVMIGDTNGVAQFTASKGTFRVAKGTPQGGESPLTRIGSSGTYRGSARVTYRSGAVSDPFLSDAIQHGDYVFAVLVQSQSPWGGLSLTNDDRSRPDEYSCEHCGHEFASYQTHVCGIPTCPECGRCSCEGHTSRETCSRCGLQKASHLLTGGICVDCE